jgi:SAM-dependent methyltransferase
VPRTSPAFPAKPLLEELVAWREFGKPTLQRETLGVPTVVNEFWTSAQRAAHSLHEVSYRACFKPQLPRFFVQRLSRSGDLVYDPFLGRGTTVIEAALLGRRVAGCDVNPLSRVLVEPRLDTPDLADVEARLDAIDLRAGALIREDLLVFFHETTLHAISGLRDYLLRRERERKFDRVDRWIRMVAVNRLTGHSPGFFSVYTLPPNQATSITAQRRINRRLKQKPQPRDVARLILKKSRSLLQDGGLHASSPILLTRDSTRTPELRNGSVALAVTSPPFLDVVQYATDNWLRCWFCGIDAERVEITVVKRLPEWREAMTGVMREVARVLRPGGLLAFEVGEVRGGSLRLEEEVIPCGRAAGLDPVLVMIHDQKFTKTANCWGVGNNRAGTNTNRVVLLRRPG